MTPWRRYWWHLVVAVLALAGAASGLLDHPGVLATGFWFLCLYSGLYNGVLFGVGWQQTRQRAGMVHSNA
jgi:hypothetical protein